MYSWELVWFIMWVTMVCLFTGAVLVLIALGVFMGVRSIVAWIRFRNDRPRIDREDDAREAAETAEWLERVRAKSTPEE